MIGAKTKALINDFKKLFPAIEFTPEFSWAGTFGTTKDGLPYIGSYRNHANEYFALGFGGNGIVFSLIAAEIIRDSILGIKNTDADIFAFNRF
jgi:glycine/D-amino acid oxidase-like deaminating enzyme